MTLLTRSTTFNRLAVLVMCLFVAGCDLSDSDVDPDSEEDAPLETIEAETLEISPQRWPTIIRSQGSLNANEETIVGSRVAGQIAEVNVELGDQVKLGDPLFSLDLAEFQIQFDLATAQYNQAVAAVGLAPTDSVAQLDPNQSPPVREAKALWDEAKSQLKRAKNLREQNAIAQGELEEAMAAERVAEAQHAAAINSVKEKIAIIGVRKSEVALAQQALDDATIESPIDGFVKQRDVAFGSYVAIGQPTVTLVRTNPLRFRGTVPERFALLLSVGQALRLKIESVEEVQSGKITRISPSLDQRSRALTFESEVSNENFQLRTGLFVEAEIVVDPDATAIVIPHTSLIEFAGTQKVWKIVDDVALEQEVLAGERRAEGREILNGLEPGDQILLNAHQGRSARIQSTNSANQPSQ